MDFTGKIHDVQIEYRSRKPVISFLVDQEPNGIDELQDKKLTIKVGEEKKPRSLLSNSYFHALCDKLRQKMGVSFSYCKNLMIIKYGQIEYLPSGEEIYITTSIEPMEMMETQIIHAECMLVNVDGTFDYRIRRGSRTYSTKEMAKLIEGTIYECKQQGIETIPPMELKRLAKIAEDKKRDKAGR